MATLYTKVKLYLEANSNTWDNNAIVLQNDGSGDYIKTWTVSGLDKPTDEQLASYETAANTEETNLQNEEANKETKKASGKQKLLDLGLTEEEVKALIGV
jgi:predicted DNA binding protein|tara:strand:+ start:458 stop:757 length:300 start_codon:yes stop_codon:yes gene_type:complete